jgi:lipopolysaccharide exporter
MERFEPGQAPDIELELANSAEESGLASQAARGVGILVGRTVILQVLTAGVTIALARLLSPADYGLFAIAMAIQLVGQRLTELGLPAALIRLREDPSDDLQRAVVTLMLAISGTLASVGTAIAFILLPLFDSSDRLLEVIAVALLATPFYALRSRPTIVMERRLDFGRVALVETVDTLTFNAFALTAAVAGLGAFSLAGAVPAGALASALVAMRIERYPKGLTRNLAPIRSLLRFSVGTSVFQGIGLARELGFVAIIASFGGAALAGYYSMAKRLFSFPIALNSAVFRVSLPTLSRGSGEEQRRRAARMATSSAIVTALALALVAGSAYSLTSVVLGDRWLPTVDILLIGSIAMFLGSSVIATVLSLSLAQADSRVPVIGAIAETVVLFACILLIQPVGPESVGIALLVGTAAQTALLLYLQKPFGRATLLELGTTLAIGVVAASATLALPLSEDLFGLCLGLVITTALWTALSLLFNRRPLAELARAVRPLLDRLRTRRPSAA